MEKLSFNKRILLAKKEVFEGVKSSGELENIKGTNTTGFYSLSTIYKFLYPALEKYDLDLDLWIEKSKIFGIWYDCESDKTREIEIDFSRIENIGKLQLMANEVMSEGAVKSYTRRYALTSILQLPSTDLIETLAPKTAPTPQLRSQLEKIEPINKPQPKPVNTKNEEQLLSRIKNIIYIASGKDRQRMPDILEDISKFTTNDGKIMPGLKDFNKLTGKRINVVYGTLKKAFPEIVDQVKKKEEEKESGVK